MAVAAFLGYRAMTSGTNIVLPDELLGMERVDPGLPDRQGGREQLVRRRDRSPARSVELNVGTYMSDGQVLVVAAAETGLDDGAEQDDYFTGFAQGFGRVDAASRVRRGGGGIERWPHAVCQQSPVSGQTAGACTWVSEDTIGMTMLIAPETDVADAARTVRSVIEQ